MPAPVVLYTLTGCPHSDAKRAALASRGVVVCEVNVSERPDAVPELLKLTRGRRIVPVIVEGATIAIAPDGGTTF